MPLIRAMNAAISGLKSQQFKIDTIGDNLANATTTGFKANNVQFKTLLSQTIRFGTAPQGFIGGVNPIQQGLGVSIASNQRNFTQGQIETTGVAGDLAIEGAGFFVMRNATGEQVYTRDGSFSVSSQNLLHDASNGNIIQGINADLTTFTLPVGTTLQDIRIPLGNLQVAVRTRNAFFEGNLNGNGEQALMGTTLQSAQFLDALDNPATAATALAGLQRQSTSGPVDLLIGLGDTLSVSATKGGRALPEQRFFVGASLPVGYDGYGTTLGDFATFMERALGINTGPALQYGAIRDNDTNPNTTGVSFGASAVSATSVQVVGTNFTTEGVQIGDILRFNTGVGAGQVAQVTAVAGDTLTIATLSSTLPTPQIGDQFTIHEPAGVSVSASAATSWLTDGALHVAGNIGTANAISELEIFNVTDNISITPFAELDAATGESVISNATVFDSNGAAHLVELTFVLETVGGMDAITGAPGNTWRVFGESADSELLDTNNVVLGSNRIIGDGQVVFSTSGQFLSQQASNAGDFIALHIPNTGAETPLQVVPDFSGLTGFAGISSNAFLESQDGFSVGTLTDFAIGSDGVVTGIFSNGLTRSLAQLYLAKFPNANGLEEIGESNFQQAANSGQPILGQAGTIGLGTLVSGALESSNVDFANEFTDLIVSQRAFQANARVITTADKMLEDLVNIV